MAVNLNNVAKFIAEKCANETTSGSYIVHEDDVPEDVLRPGLFAAYIETIAFLLQTQDSVAEADVEDGAISVVMYTDYCPNYEPCTDDFHNREVA